MFTTYDVLEQLNFARSGWVRRGIPLPLCETVAQHCLKVSRASAIVARARGWDVEKARLMGLSHDFCEVYSGDPTPFDNLSVEQKYSNERIAFERLAGQMHDGAQFLSLWLEYEEGVTDLAKTVMQLDKMDAPIQAITYHNKGYTAVEDFFPWARTKLVDDRLLFIYDMMMAERGLLHNPYREYFELLQNA